MTDFNKALSQCPGNGKFFLVGFMGSGKSHWGSIWAAAHELIFVDLDNVIEAAEGKSIATIFENEGEAHFRKLEAAALRESAHLKNTIIACGGGAPCYLGNMQWMNEHGTTIYINCTVEEILQRVLNEQDKRPLLKQLDKAELIVFIQQKIQERDPFYTLANITVQSAELTEDSFATIVSNTNH